MCASADPEEPARSRTAFCRRNGRRTKRFFPTSLWSNSYHSRRFQLLHGFARRWTISQRPRLVREPRMLPTNWSLSFFFFFFFLSGAFLLLLLLLLLLLFFFFFLRGGWGCCFCNSPRFSSQHPLRTCASSKCAF